MKMFWGLILEPGKKYEHKSESSFHLTMAALEPSTKQPAPNKSTITSVLLESSKSQYILCNLDQSKVLQQPLDCVFMEGEDITFSVNGEGKVHLTGYIMPDSDLEDMYDMDSDEEDSEEEMGAAINDKKRKQLTQDVKNAGKKVKLGGDELGKAEKKEEKKQPGKPIKVETPAKGTLKAKKDAEDDDDDDDDDDEDDDMDSDDMADLLDTFDDGDDDDEDDDEDDDDEEGDSSPEIKKGPKQPQAQIKTPNQKGTPFKGQQQQQKSPGQQLTPPQKKPFQQGGKQQWSHGKNQNSNQKFNKNQNSGRKATPHSNSKFGGSPGNKNKKPWIKK